MSVSCPLCVRNYTQVFPGSGKRREEYHPTELTAQWDTGSKRLIQENFHEKAHLFMRNPRKEIPFNWEEIKKSFIKEVAKEVAREEEGSTVWAMPIPWRREDQAWNEHFTNIHLGEWRSQKAATVLSELLTSQDSDEKNGGKLYIHATLSFAEA